MFFASLSRFNGSYLRSIQCQRIRSESISPHVSTIIEQIQHSIEESDNGIRKSRFLQSSDTTLQPTSSPSKSPTTPNHTGNNQNNSAVAITYLVYFFILCGVGLFYYFFVLIGRLCRFFKPGVRLWRAGIRLCIYIGVMDSSEAIPATAQIVSGNEENKDEGDSTAVVVEIMPYNSSDYTTVVGNDDNSTVPIVTAKRVTRPRPTSTEAVAVASIER